MKIVLLLIMSLTFAFASSEIHFTKGWSLVSVPSTLKNMNDFNNDNVEVMWAYDASKQLWKGYSPNKPTMEKILDKNIETLETLKTYQAFWIFNKEDWKLSIKEGSLKSVDNESIYLKKGWNLVSLPQRVSVDSSFFKDALVWKYSQKSGWSVNDASLSFPTIKDIKESDALWVKSEEDVKVDMSEALSKLQTFSSEDDMLAYIREMSLSNNYYYRDVYYINETIATPLSVDTLADSGATTKAVDATTTNLQELGVDEADIMKHNGEYIFSVDRKNSQIFITSFTNVASKSYKELNSISTKGKNVVAMYLQNNRLILLSNNVGEYHILNGEDLGKKSSLLYPNPTSKQNFNVEVYDVSNILSIELLSSYEIDGNYQESRVVDKKLFLISSFYPEIQYDYPKVQAEGVCATLDKSKLYSNCSNEVLSIENVVSVEEPKKVSGCNNSETYDTYYKNLCYEYTYDDNSVWKYDYENPTIASENLIPNIKTLGTSSPLVTPSKLYAPVKLNQTATITTLSSFNIDDASFKESLSFVGNTHTYYASTTAFYLVSSEYPLYYDYYNYKEQQMIYKFSIGESLEYKAKGFVDGRMLNQFSMSEYGEYLRVATSSGSSWSSTSTQNSVYTLKETENVLEVKGTLKGLGKEGELIKAVRFMGDRGFVVTFKQTDPLYTLDMSDPLVPKVIGELSIPGFSRYLHIVDENRVLSIGRDADEKGRTLGLILQLFDISDFAKPLLADKLQIGSESTYSPAEYNHKAFAYRSSDMMFGLPYTEYDYSSYNSSSEKFGIYKIDGMKLSEVKLLTQTNKGSYWYSDKRGLIFDLDGYSYGALIEGSNIISESLNKEEIQ